MVLGGVLWISRDVDWNPPSNHNRFQPSLALIYSRLAFPPCRPDIFVDDGYGWLQKIVLELTSRDVGWLAEKVKMLWVTEEGCGRVLRGFLGMLVSVVF